jgi:hypothetical protein
VSHGVFSANDVDESQESSYVIDLAWDDGDDGDDGDVEEDF